MPGWYRTPGGRSIALFVYDGPLSHDVAFGPLLSDAAAWAERLVAPGKPGSEPRLVAIATDGETYGHHHRFGEVALAWLLRELERRAGVRVENFAAFLARHPPEREVKLVAPTSWSCPHGVERWRAGCGCRLAPEHPSPQRWRAPPAEAPPRPAGGVPPPLPGGGPRPRGGVAGAAGACRRDRAGSGDGARRVPESGQPVLPGACPRRGGLRRRPPARAAGRRGARRLLRREAADRQGAPDSLPDGARLPVPRVGRARGGDGALGRRGGAGRRGDRAARALRSTRALPVPDHRGAACRAGEARPCGGRGEVARHGRSGPEARRGSSVTARGCGARARPFSARRCHRHGPCGPPRARGCDHSVRRADGVLPDPRGVPARAGGGARAAGVAPRLRGGRLTGAAAVRLRGPFPPAGGKLRPCVRAARARCVPAVPRAAGRAGVLSRLRPHLGAAPGVARGARGGIPPPERAARRGRPSRAAAPRLPRAPARRPP